MKRLFALIAALALALAPVSATSGPLKLKIRGGASAPVGPVFIVHNDTEYEAATLAAKTSGPNTTIRAVAGAYTNKFGIGNTAYTNLTITSDGGCAAKTTVPGILAVNSSGVTWECLDVTPDFNPGYHTNRIVYVSNSSSIVVKNSILRGDLDPGTDDRAVDITQSSNVTLSGNEIKWTATSGVSSTSSSNVFVLNNYIHNPIQDAIQFGPGPYNNVQIIGNFIKDFDPSPGDHTDGIQFLTTGATGAITNVKINNNTVCSGTTPRTGPPQGIFLNNESSTPYDTVEITGNLIIGGQYSGIAIAQAGNLTITGNTIIEFSDQNSNLNYGDITSGVVTGNNVPRINGTGTNVGTFSPNTTGAPGSTVPVTTTCPTAPTPP